MNRIASLVLPLLFAVACNKPVPPDTLPPEATGATAPAVDKAATDAAVAKMREHFTRVHFESDASTLDAEGKTALTANVAIMQKHAALVVEVQGHCDERGTTDYNLALGNRRADTVKTYMIAQGLAPGRISVLTYGEEHPLVAGAGEPAWSQNRRAEFRVSVAGSSDGLVTGTTE